MGITWKRYEHEAEQGNRCLRWSVCRVLKASEREERMPLDTARNGAQRMSAAYRWWAQQQGSEGNSMIERIIVRYVDGEEDEIEYQDGVWYFENTRFDFLDQAILHAHEEHERETQYQRKRISAAY